MKILYKILRSVLVTLLALIFIIPATLYVALSLPAVQQMVCEQAESELSKLLSVKVDIDYVRIAPFNRVTLHGVAIGDDRDAPAIKVDRIGAGVNIWDYLTHRRIVVSYAELIGLDAHIYRDSIGAPLNIQPIIDAISPKDKSKQPTRFDFRINNVVIRTSAIAYDVLSEPESPGRFCSNHILLTDLSADLRMPRVKNDDFEVHLKRLTFKEQSGLTLNNLSGIFSISAAGASIKNLAIAMPRTSLRFADIDLRYSSWADIQSHWRTIPIDIRLLDNSHVGLADFRPLLPADATDLDFTFATTLAAKGSVSDLDIPQLKLESARGVLLDLSGHISGLADTTGLSFDFPHIEAIINAPLAIATSLPFVNMPPATRVAISNLGDVQLSASLQGSPEDANISARIASAVGSLDASSEIHRRPGNALDLTAEASIESFDGSLLAAGTTLPIAHLSDLEAIASGSASLKAGRLTAANADLDIARIVYHGKEINGITANLTANGPDYSATVSVDDAEIILSADATAHIDPAGIHEASIQIDTHGLDMALLQPLGKFAAYTFSGSLDADLSGRDLNDIAGSINLRQLKFLDHNGEGASIDRFSITSTHADIPYGPDSIIIESDLLDGHIYGSYRPIEVVAVVKALIAQLLPSLPSNNVDIPGEQFWADHSQAGDFDFDLVLKTLDPLGSIVKLPVRVINPIEIIGNLSTLRRSMRLNVDIPYLQQGNRLIENTAFSASVFGSTPDAPLATGHFNLTTTLPTKKGAMVLATNADIVDNQIDSKINWRIARDRNFSGDINTSARFSRNDDNRLRTDIHINPGNMVFNDTVWTIDPALISIEDKEIVVENFKVWRDKQYIAMSGRASASPTDTITLDLADVNLDYIFETLDIPTAQFGGNATGRFYATQILTPDPVAFTPDLKVKSLTYNQSLMGDASIRSRWEADRKAVYIHADIDQPNQRQSIVDGRIFPMADSLDLSFEADRIEIGFLHYYMQAFASSIHGYASGKARLWGTFKLIDMVGDIYGEDVSLTIGFTNTTYTTTDSVRLTPGRIDLNNLTLTDIYGNKARLNGWLTHKCFKEPRFKFDITDARDLLVYDVKQNPEFAWYGRVFGNGKASVSGEPGIVDINVAMSTAPKTQFTFVLSDVLSAQDYNFITFRDRDRARKDSIAALNAPPPLVLELKNKINASAASDHPSDYRMLFNIDITPQAQLTLIMDPVGGDAIKAHGRGNVTMRYGSADEAISLNGVYTVNDGQYNFTLQDIIRKDFTLVEGSSIAFNGDPYAAQLDITAKYSTHGNLTDLDESFLEDKELNRTNVTVDALLKVNGDMRQPEISFDLDFPTLTEETKRKVQSIINTDEMMNRQIIYLLALNRFYTPDYMTATRGNEFVSVASSTISSQLSNILGQLSDNWNIAPNFRSSRGDFSDVEVDVALSSTLLNNRLLLNGNLGYRDKSLNNNSFIGDFDIEYLLNRSGSLRLKAYNRYNDQNYYLKSALTTQGVGIVFKRDFDNMFSFLRPLFSRKKKSTEAADSIPAADSLKTAAPLLPDSIK